MRIHRTKRLDPAVGKDAVLRVPVLNPENGDAGDHVPTNCGRLRHAFSLIEIMVTMGLLTFIILGLLLMFNQTQRAFRSSMTQSDVLEAGRAIVDLLAREMREATPSGCPDFFMNGAAHRATNFFAEPTIGFPNPFLQQLPGNSPLRTNIVQRFFFLSKLNQDWLGTGYQVIPEDGNGVIGTLYRFPMTNASRYGSITASGSFIVAAETARRNAKAGLPITNANRVVDGVVHLRMRVFATNGFPIVANTVTSNGVFALGPFGPYTNMPNTSFYGTAAVPEQAAYYFMSNAVPAYVELELGIVEPQILQRYRALPVPQAQLAYLSNNVGAVHIFRQRIPIPNVDFSAYP